MYLVYFEQIQITSGERAHHTARCLTHTTADLQCPAKQRSMDHENIVAVGMLEHRGAEAKPAGRSREFWYAPVPRPAAPIIQIAAAEAIGPTRCRRFYLTAETPNRPPNWSKSGLAWCQGEIFITAAHRFFQHHIVCRRACFIAFVLIELIKYVEQSTAAHKASAVCARLLIQICRSPPDLWPFRYLFACAATDASRARQPSQFLTPKQSLAFIKERDSHWRPVDGCQGSGGWLCPNSLEIDFNWGWVIGSRKNSALAPSKNKQSAKFHPINFQTWNL